MRCSKLRCIKVLNRNSFSIRSTLLRREPGGALHVSGPCCSLSPIPRAPPSRATPAGAENEHDVRPWMISRARNQGRDRAASSTLNHPLGSPELLPARPLPQLPGPQRAALPRPMYLSLQHRPSAGGRSGTSPRKDSFQSACSYRMLPAWGAQRMVREKGLRTPPRQGGREHGEPGRRRRAGGRSGTAPRRNRFQSSCRTGMPPAPGAEGVVREKGLQASPRKGGREHGQGRRRRRAPLRARSP